MKKITTILLAFTPIIFYSQSHAHGKKNKKNEWEKINWSVVYLADSAKVVTYTVTPGDVLCEKFINRKKANVSFKDCKLDTIANKISKYRSSVYDRGHLQAAADKRCELLDYQRTFLSCNISPQIANFNRITWAREEKIIRKMLTSTDTFTVVIRLSSPFFTAKGLKVFKNWKKTVTNKKKTFKLEISHTNK